MVSTGWQFKVGRETFHQYLLRTVTSSNPLNNNLDKPLPLTSHTTEFWSVFTANSPVSLFQQNTLTVTTSPLSFTTIPTFAQTYVTDDGDESAQVDFITILTTEDLIYFAVLALVAILLFSVGGYQLIINCFYGCSILCTKSRREHRQRRTNPELNPSSLPLLTPPELDCWESSRDTTSFSTFAPRPFLPLRRTTIRGWTAPGGKSLHLYDHPQFELRPVQSTRTVQFAPSIDIIPLPEYPTPTEPGESELSSDNDEDWIFPPTPAAVRNEETDATYWQMVWVIRESLDRSSGI